MTKNDPVPPPSRRPYRKPVVEKVLLSAEEAVLAACKGPTSPGKNDVLCRIPSCKFTVGS